jgi:hypothetical protein
MTPARVGWGAGYGRALVQWLGEGGRGAHLETVTVDNDYGLARNLVHEALQQGALPSLKVISASLEYETHRASLTEGLLGGMHELRLTIASYHREEDMKPQLAALGLVRELPALAKLEVCTLGETPAPVEWPPFIPPSLKALCMDVSGSGHLHQSLLRALPGMLGASGARLNRLEVHISSDFKAIGDGLVHVAQALRRCSPALEGFVLVAGSFLVINIEEGAEDYHGQVERRRVQWTDVLAGVSACRELQVLVLPHIEVEPLFPTGTAFDRLTHLEISDHEREHPPDAGVMGLWELMASGGLPWPSSA